MPVYLLIATFAIGTCAGFLNTIAGGGSLLALPFLVFLGLDASVANATNRVAILLQNIVATGRFRKRKVLSFREAATLAAPATMGAVCGTLLAVQLDEKFLKVLIALLITAMAVLLVTKPDMWESQGENKWPRWLTMVIFFFIGVYGGFIQAGVGFMLIWALVGVVGKDLVRANALKVAIVMAYTAVSLALFMSYGMVNFGIGFALAAGNMAGAWIGTWFAVEKGNRWIRYILAGVVAVSAFRMILQALGT
ncbi:MAG: sulfite exporter TauE/SafE family protein [Thermovirgaceae bacterium]